MKIFLIIAFVVLAASCAKMPQNGVKTFSGTYLGELKGRMITQAQSRFQWPARTKWGVVRIEARDIGANRYEEAYWFKRGWARINQVYTGGFTLASDETFRRMAGGFQFIDAKALRIRRKGDLKFARLTYRNAPCIVFTGVFGTTLWRTDIYDGEIFGLQCAPGAQSPTMLKAQVTASFENLKFR